MNVEIPTPSSDAEQAAWRKRKRLAMSRGQTACNPCRMRKVKCSFQLPCYVCIERGHPELCVYAAAQRRTPITPLSGGDHIIDHTASTDSSLLAAPWPPSRVDWEALRERVARLEQASSGDSCMTTPGRPDGHVSLRYDGGAPAFLDQDPTGSKLPSQDMYSKHILTGETVFLGANSVPAMAVALSYGDESRDIRGVLDKSVLPAFALENESATHPFINLWDIPRDTTHRIERLCALLPDDAACLQYLRHYRDIAQVLYPGIVRMPLFEAEVTQFLVTRATEMANPRAVRLSEQNVYGQNAHWLGLLFAALASGCQCSNLQRTERQLTSQVYVCCAYECLRVVNYLSCANLHDIQSLLVVGNVISNNMNAGVAWVLLGLTIRLAQSLGLHRPEQIETSRTETSLRFDIWATSTTEMTNWTAPSPTTSGPLLYADCMLKLCAIALRIISGRAATNPIRREIQQIEGFRQEILAIDEQGCAHLQDASACASMINHLEHWNWRMHRSYVISELCRPMLAKKQHHNKSAQTLRARCIEALTETVAAFLGLQKITDFALVSWAAVHRSLSSALLLCILKEPTRSEDLRAMLDKLIVVMSRFTTTDPSEMPAPISRAVDALTRLNVAGSDSNSPAALSSASDIGSIDEHDVSPHAQVQTILWSVQPDVI